MNYHAIGFTKNLESTQTETYLELAFHLPRFRISLKAWSQARINCCFDTFFIKTESDTNLRG